MEATNAMSLKSAGSSITIDASNDITSTAGGSTSVTAGTNVGITASSGDLHATAGKAISMNAGGTLSATSGSSTTINAGSNLKMEAVGQFDIKSATSGVDITATNGNFNVISGKTVDVTANNAISMKSDTGKMTVTAGSDIVMNTKANMQGLNGTRVLDGATTSSDILNK